MKAFLAAAASCSFLAATSIPASASFHMMQIEQVIGGVDGNTSVQAIQLRMRAIAQSQVQNARLIVRDATGANPILLIDFTTSVATSATGSRVLAATSNFSSFTNSALTPDFVLTNTIPASYLAAGTLTFESDGSTTNDADGDFDPPFSTSLPSANGKALAFQFAATAASTNNANDYLLTPGPATFVRNNSGGGTIISTVGVGEPSLSLGLGNPFPNPVHGVMTYAVSLPRVERVRVDVLDMTGRRVSRLLDDVVPAGRNAFGWDGRTESLRSGVYTLVMEAGGTRVLRRFVFVLDARAPSPYFGPHPD